MASIGALQYGGNDIGSLSYVPLDRVRQYANGTFEVNEFVELAEPTVYTKGSIGAYGSPGNALVNAGAYSFSPPALRAFALRIGSNVQVQAYEFIEVATLGFAHRINTSGVYTCTQLIETE